MMDNMKVDNHYQKINFPVVQEATATGDPELLKTVLESRDLQRFSSRVLGIPNLLLKLSEVWYLIEQSWNIVRLFCCYQYLASIFLSFSLMYQQLA